MKLVQYFNQMLEEKIDLKEYKFTLLNQKVQTISTFFKQNEVFKELYINTYPQGSFGHGTIINPVRENHEFDADILLHVEENSEWEPKDYIDNVYKQLKANKFYEDIVSRRTRCVVINYKGNFHVDVVPCIKKENTISIMNNKENEFEETNPRKYTEWLKAKNTKTGNKLKKVIRIFKYLRDHKITFSAKSILINTLLGNCVYESDTPNKYLDVVDSFTLIMDRLDKFLQANPTMPIITNPVCAEETFNRHWDQKKYENFRERISFYNKKIKEAIAETDKNQAIKKWQEIFGDAFPEELTKKNNDTLENIKKEAKDSKPWSY